MINKINASRFAVRQDILPLPQVSQSGPRVPKQKKILGALKFLTSSPEMKRIREKCEEKHSKEKQAENRRLQSLSSQNQAH